MIVGTGDIAKVIEDRESILFFASGVSNSQETRESEYRREIDLLLDQNIESHIVYFSSLCIFYSDTRYARHKREMEKLVKTFKTWTIVRLGNITWGTNPHTIINNLRAKKERNEQIEIQDAYRYLCSLEEFHHWLRLIPEWSCEMNLPGKRMKIQEIVDTYL